ncbi:MAG TPA: cytochrome P460 family protein [Bryobacteraceae bacterium]|jgi:hypothetical protein
MRRAKYLALVFVLNACSGHHPGESDLFNSQAALLSDVPVPVMEWRVISSSVDRQHGTMSTLTGNELAVTAARSAGSSFYPAGSVLALATWAQREDPHWFGARIPAYPQSIETVTMTENGAGRPVTTYKRYAGRPMKELPDVDAATAAARTAYIVAQRASVMP